MASSRPAQAAAGGPPSASLRVRASRGGKARARGPLLGPPTVTRLADSPSGPPLRTSRRRAAPSRAAQRPSGAPLTGKGLLPVLAPSPPPWPACGGLDITALCQPGPSSRTWPMVDGDFGAEEPGLGGVTAEGDDRTRRARDASHPLHGRQTRGSCRETAGGLASERTVASACCARRRLPASPCSRCSAGAEESGSSPRPVAGRPLGAERLPPCSPASRLPSLRSASPRLRRSAGLDPVCARQCVSFVGEGPERRRRGLGNQSSPSRRGGQAAAVLHRRNPCGWLAASSGQAVAPCRWGAGPHGAVEAGRAVNEARPVPESLVVVGNQRAWRRMGRRAQRRHPAAVGRRSRAGGRQARGRSELARVASAAACHSAPGLEGTSRRREAGPVALAASPVAGAMPGGGRGRRALALRAAPL